MSRKKGTKAIDCSPSPEDANKLIQSCEDPIDKMILAGAMFLGLDKGMIAHLTKTWIILHENIIKIPDSQKCSKSCCKEKRKGIWRPKGKQSKDGFVSYRNKYTRYYGNFPWAKEIIKSFFGIYDKFPLSERAINSRLDRMSRRAKLEKHITVHGLRSFAASNYSQMVKGDISKLCALMGWEEGSPMAQEYVKLYDLRQTLEENKDRSLI